MPGAGKSVVADEIVKSGFAYLRFGQITIDRIKDLGLEVSEANEKKVREGFRKKYGMAAFAILNIGKIDRLVKKSHLVIDGLYSWSEYKTLKEKYGRLMYVLAIYAPPELRYQRLGGRKTEKEDKKSRFRPLSREEAKKRDYAEIEHLEKGGPIAMADFTIVNTGTMEELRDNVREITNKIISHQA